MVPEDRLSFTDSCWYRRGTLMAATGGPLLGSTRHLQSCGGVWGWLRHLHSGSVGPLEGCGLCRGSCFLESHLLGGWLLDPGGPSLHVHPLGRGCQCWCRQPPLGPSAPRAVASTFAAQWMSYPRSVAQYHCLWYLGRVDMDIIPIIHSSLLR